VQRRQALAIEKACVADDHIDFGIFKRCARAGQIRNLHDRVPSFGQIGGKLAQCRTSVKEQDTHARCFHWESGPIALTTRAYRLFHVLTPLPASR
jgi:hypothetical protein